MSVRLEILSAGDGFNYPTKGSTAIVHYTAFLSDGNQWDSTRERKPFRFKIGCEQVIPGLDIGVSQLSIGERAKLTIPPSLGYGRRGFPGLVPPDSELVFDIELLSFS